MGEYGAIYAKALAEFKAKQQKAASSGGNSPQPPSKDAIFLEHVLEDWAQATEALNGGFNSQVVRRTLARAVFAAAEGAISVLKNECLRKAKVLPTIYTDAELAVLKEEQYGVREDGTAHTRPLSVPTLANLRFAVAMVVRHPPGLRFSLDTGGGEWRALRDALQIRHRVTHPRTIEDSTIADDDLGALIAGGFWFVGVIRDLTVAVQNAVIAYRRSHPNEPA